MRKARLTARMGVVRKRELASLRTEEDREATERGEEERAREREDVRDGGALDRTEPADEADATDRREWER